MNQRKMLLDTFYFLNKDYGTTIQYTRVGKPTVDDETGVVQTNNRTTSIPAVLTPVSAFGNSILKLLGREEKRKPLFLILKEYLPEISIDDYFVHGNLTYRKLEFDEYESALVAISGENSK